MKKMKEKDISYNIMVASVFDSCLSIKLFIMYVFLINSTKKLKNYKKKNIKKYFPIDDQK